MIRLFDVNEQNWPDIISLHVREEQKYFLDNPSGILARGYVYRSCRARVFGIFGDTQVMGVALVKDLDEEPSCYDLQQFMIDERFQHRGYGTEALRLILSLLSAEGKYPRAEVCVHRDNAAALALFQKAGFKDTGYVDEAVPDCLNLMFHFEPEYAPHCDTMISDFSGSAFQTAFRQYFSELEIHIGDWDGLFAEMNNDGDNLAFVRTAQNGKIIGFLQFKPTKFTSWFFEETCGFIREFWIAPEFRNQNHGTALLRLAEKHFLENGIYTSILTSDTATPFYEKHGYVKAPGCKAKNRDPVFLKHLT